MGKSNEIFDEFLDIIIKFSKAFLLSVILLFCIFLLQKIRKFLNLGDQNLEDTMARITNYVIIVGFIGFSFGSLLRNYIVEAKKTGEKLK